LATNIICYKHHRFAEAFSISNNYWLQTLSAINIVAGSAKCFQQQDRSTKSPNFIPTPTNINKKKKIIVFSAQKETQNKYNQ